MHESYEIRKVPEGYQNPQDEKGRPICLWDDVFDQLWDEWLTGLRNWLTLDIPNPNDYKNNSPNVRDYIELEGPCPDARDFANYNGQARTHFQLYSGQKGQPGGYAVTPALPTMEALQDHLLRYGSVIHPEWTNEEVITLCKWHYQEPDKRGEDLRLKAASQLARKLKSIAKGEKQRFRL